MKLRPPEDLFEREEITGDSRATFIHPDGRSQRTEYGQASVGLDGVVFTSAPAVPSWATDDGVEVVVAAKDGSVEAAFEVESLIRASGIARVHPPE